MPIDRTLKDSGVLEVPDNTEWVGYLTLGSCSTA
jgi:hypothetical protein